MSGRKCEICHKSRIGYCPFDFRCEFEVWDVYVRNSLRKMASERPPSGGAQ